MSAEKKAERKFYKSIVIAMCVCLPLGIGYGIAEDQVAFGLLTGNAAGFVFGAFFSRIINKPK